MCDSEVQSLANFHCSITLLNSQVDRIGFIVIFDL